MPPFPLTNLFRAYYERRNLERVVGFVLHGLRALTDYVCVLGQVFLNIVLDEAVEEKAGGEKVRIGMVVRYFALLQAYCCHSRGVFERCMFADGLCALQVIRGNSVVMLEVWHLIDGVRSLRGWLTRGDLGTGANRR